MTIPRSIKVVVTAPQHPIVVMGVSGCGKTTIGLMLAEHYGVSFLDADTLHSASNKIKMASGMPLDDIDRAP